MPPISTLRWYDAPPPGALCRSESPHVPTADRVRSQVSGAALETDWPAARSTTMSLGSVWQSVERHQMSLPLMMVNDWPLVPTLRVQSVAPLFVSVIDSCGFCPGSYVSWSLTAWTATSRATQGFAVGVASGDAVGSTSAAASAVFVGVGVGVAISAVSGTGRSVAVACVADGVGVGVGAAIC